jgi:hypothetical protein
MVVEVSKEKECQLRYLVKALVMLARPGAEVREDFQNCIKEHCMWYNYRGCMLVD